MSTALNKSKSMIKGCNGTNMVGDLDTRTPINGDDDIVVNPVKPFKMRRISGPQDLDIVYEKQPFRRRNAIHKNEICINLDDNKEDEEEDEVHFLGATSGLSRGLPKKSITEVEVNLFIPRKEDSRFPRPSCSSTINAEQSDQDVIITKHISPQHQFRNSRIGIRPSRGYIPNSENRNIRDQVDCHRQSHNVSGNKKENIHSKVFFPFTKHSTRPAPFSASSSTPNVRHEREMQQYKKLVDYFRKSKACAPPVLISQSTDSRLSTTSNSYVSRIDCEKELTTVRVDKSKELTPVTKAAQIADESDIICIDQESKTVGSQSPNARPGISRVNSFKDFLKYHDINPEEMINEIKMTYSLNVTERKIAVQVEERRIKLLSEHNHKALAQAVEDRVRNYLRISEPPPISELEEDESEKNYQLPQLTKDQSHRVDEVLKSTGLNDIIANKDGYTICKRDIITLKGNNWLNDEVVNFYMTLIMARAKESKEKLPSVYCFNSFFYPKLSRSGFSSLKRWTRKIDIFGFDMVLVPIHLGMHWCMLMIDFKRKEIQYFDSLGMPNNDCLKLISQYLKEEMYDKKKTAFNDVGWKSVNVSKIPKQLNSYDCGVFACAFAEHLARKKPFGFSQDHMPTIRKKMVYEILEGKLLT